MSIISSGAAIDPAMWAASTSLQPATPGADGAPNGLSPSSSERSAKAKEVGQQFEALFLRQMLEECMPKDSDELFGGGTAGTVWRSMFVDNLATTLSKSGTMGIAKMIVNSATKEPEGR